MANTVTMKALLETGVHFGHRTRKWNPKMREFIFTERNGIHILDLHQTLQSLKHAYDLVRDTVSDGGTIMFVGTKRQAQETISREAMRAGMPWVSERWLGGTLTNWRTIRKRIDYLKELERRQGHWRVRSADQEGSARPRTRDDQTQLSSGRHPRDGRSA